MRIDALKYRTEDDQDIIIVVDICCGVGYTRNHIWRIADIGYKTVKQRKYNYLSGVIRNDWNYHKLDSADEREQYALNEFIKFVGEDKLKEALIAAYQSISPDLTELHVANM